MADPDLIDMLVAGMQVVEVEEVAMDPPETRVNVYLSATRYISLSAPPHTTTHQLKTRLQESGHLPLNPFEYQFVDTFGEVHLDRVTLEQIQEGITTRTRDSAWGYLMPELSFLELWVQK